MKYDGLIRFIKLFQHYLYLISLKTYKKFSVILECSRATDNEKKEIGKLLMQGMPLRFFPYHFPDNYNEEDIKVFRDEEKYPYVLHNNKKLYMKKKWSDRQCKSYYNSIRIEQYNGSPHKYLKSESRFPKNDVVADIGAAEGIFGLEIIEIVKHLYLFEAEEDWLIPLRKTFSPWCNKVNIVRKYVSNKDHGNNITLDSFFKNKEISYIKADIEGAEELMLQGASETLSKVNRMLLCTYHRPNDEMLLKDILQKKGYLIEFNEGYVLYIWDRKTFKAPYLRRCVMFAYKR